MTRERNSEVKKMKREGGKERERKGEGERRKD